MNDIKPSGRPAPGSRAVQPGSGPIALFPHALLALALGACADERGPLAPRLEDRGAEPASAASKALEPAIEDALTRLIPDRAAARVHAALLELSASLAQGAADPEAVRAVNAAIDDYAATGAADALDVAALRLSVDLLASPED
ncbi:MAG TPA: hypothetical protein VK939_15450 [Longimicrobiales bacterium]|nr:hypothetical protein [Longimicrobiales bacterium]